MAYHIFFFRKSLFFSPELFSKLKAAEQAPSTIPPPAQEPNNSNATSEGAPPLSLSLPYLQMRDLSPWVLPTVAPEATHVGPHQEENQNVLDPSSFIFPFSLAGMCRVSQM